MLGVLFALCVLFNTVNTKSCTGTVNQLPIVDNDLIFIKQVPNGKLYQTKSIDPPINVVHLWGTPYEMGYAHGQIVKPYVDELITEVFQFIDNQVDSAIQFLPKEIREFIEVYGVNAALEATQLLTEAYTPQYVMDELRGLADGAGLEPQTIINIHMLPELIQASCSMVGAWGDASASVSSDPRTLYQLRALDWTTNGPFQKWPALIVYHPSQAGHPFSILSFTGFVGALTGYSSKNVGICEKVWLSYNGTQNRMGMPWHFLLKDILQFDGDITDAMTRIVNAKRTCSIHVGIGDPVNKFRAVEYSYETATIYNDFNYPEYPEHPRMKGLVYINKHVQPSDDPCLGDLLKAKYGSIDAEYLIRTVAAVHQTGDTHAAVYDFANNTVFAVVASPYVNGTFTPAYDRQWSKFNMTEIFSEQPPS